MPHRTRPMTSLLVFMGLNLVLVNTLSPVYDFVCFLPYWERRGTCILIFMLCSSGAVAEESGVMDFLRERRRKEREAASEKVSQTT